MTRWVLLLAAVVCSGVPASPSWPLGTSGHGNGKQEEVSNRLFDRRLSNDILERMARGRAVKVTVEESRKLSYEQAASCNGGCSNPSPAPVVQCGPQEVLLNGTCYGPFTVASIPDTVAIACAYVQGQSIPGLTLNTTNGVYPLFCNTGGSGTTPVTINVISSQIDNGAPVTDPATILNQPFVEIDSNGVAFIGAQNLPVVMGGSVLTQTYSGYCIDARGVTSNTFYFTVEFPTCP